jgi:sulfur-carrier protein adenylyltransferase/sulfurtransferase
LNLEHEGFNLVKLKMKSILEDTSWAGVHLEAAELSRYARHITIPGVGLDGQAKLKAARVLCIGAGGLGSPVCLYLAAAGVGTIGIVDDDKVEFSNLQRQIIHGVCDVGKSKISSAFESLKEVNPLVNVKTYDLRLNSQNARELAADYDVIIDGTDNFPTRYLSNDLAVLTCKPNIYGSIFRFEGQVSVFAPHLGGPCYRCLFPTPPEPGQVPSCAEGGVLGVLPGIIGCMQANEAIKLILGIGDPLIGRLVHFDALKFKFREIKLRQDPECAVCGENPSITDLKEVEFSCSLPQNQMNQAKLREITVQQLQTRMKDPKPFVLLDVREPLETQICKLPGSRLIPLGDLPGTMASLDPAAETIIHCKSGGRSLKALEILNQAGFSNVCHVAGGINAWSREIDPSVALY